MIRGVLRLAHALFQPADAHKLSGSQPTGGRGMSRRLLIAAGIVALTAAGGAYFAYDTFFRAAPPPPPVEHPDTGATLSTQQQFDKLAETDPVKMLDQCLTRYQREVKGGLRCTLQMQERVRGEPKPPAQPTVEVLDLCVHGDVPDPESKQTAIEVLMKWQSGAKVVAGSEVRGTLFSERPAADHPGKILPWRPKALLMKLGPVMPYNGKEAQGQSRYCIRDAGLYRSMLRTHKAWEARQAAGELKFEYLGKRTPEQIGRECHVIKRVCPRVELDSFEIGGTASTDPKVVAAEGHTEVTVFIDVERWLQVGTELYRTEPDGTRVPVGAYYFRDVQLNADLPPDTFTTAGLKK